MVDELNVLKILFHLLTIKIWSACKKNFGCWSTELICGFMPVMEHYSDCKVFKLVLMWSERIKRYYFHVDLYASFYCSLHFILCLLCHVELWSLLDSFYWINWHHNSEKDNVLIFYLAGPLLARSKLQNGWTYVRATRN